MRFAYPGGRGTTHDGLSFSIAAGERIGVVGSSGSGKSSIVRLLLRLYDPQAGAILMIGFGLILLAPRFGMAFSIATTGLASGADARMDRMDSTGLQGQFGGGLLLGAVWSPCIGPTLGGAIALAAQGESLLWAAAIMAAFAAGVSTLILTLGYGARAALVTHQPLMRRIAENARPFMGAVFIAVGVALLLRLHHLLDAWLLGVLPAWFVDLSVAI